MNGVQQSRNPYVRRMGGNIVAWRLWSAEALAEAQQQDKPICLCVSSNGSRWSHAMKATFEDAEAAKLLNEDYIPVLTDSEDVPHLTLAARALAQIMLGHSGWPLVVFMTPQLKPFFASSYMPLQSKDSRMPGLLDVLRRIKWLWLMKRPQVDETAESYCSQLAEALLPYTAPIEGSLRERACEQLAASFDMAHGGIGERPKFPQVPKLALAAWLCSGDDRLKKGLESALSAIASGAVYDHLSGGLHDYCTDAAWTQPCLGKHLAQSAAAVWIFAEGFKLFRSPAYWHAADDTVWSMIFSFDRGDGLLYFGDDIHDTARIDDYYLWTKDEITQILGGTADQFCRAYGVTEQGNFIDTLTGSPSGRNALCLTGLGELENRGDGDMTQIWEELSADRAKLASVRLERPKPEADVRISVRANACFAAVLARAARIMDRPAYLEYAEKIVRALLQHACGENNALCRTIYDGVRDGDAGLDDVAALIWAFLELLKTTDSPEWLAMACSWSETADELFGAEGAMRLVRDSSLEVLPAWEAGDDHLPSGNGMMVNNLVTLYVQTGEERWKDRAQSIISSFGGALNSYPAACASLLMGALRLERAAEKKAASAVR